MDKEISHSLKWDILGKIIGQISTFGISILLARLLSPNDFGLLGMTMAFYGVAGSLVNLGFSSAIVQAQDVNRLDVNSVIIVNISIGLILTSIFYFYSNLIGEFYENEIISDIVKVLSVVFVINSFRVTSIALLEKELRFKALSIVNIFSGFISGFIGVFLAYNDFGVWSLVYSSLINEILRTALVVFYVKHKFHFEFSFKSIKKFWSFGSKMFITGLLETIYQKVDYLVTGKFFPIAMLGFYYRAKSLRSLILRYTSDSIAKVFFPVFSKYQNDLNWLRKTFEKSSKYIILLSVFICAYLFLISEELFITLFTKKWLPSVLYFKILIITILFSPMIALFSNVINSLGYSNFFLKLNIYEKGFYIFALMVTVWYSEFLIFIISDVFIKIITLLFYAHKSFKLIQYNKNYLFGFFFKLLLFAVFNVIVIHFFRVNSNFTPIFGLFIFTIVYLALIYSQMQFKFIKREFDINMQIKKIIRK